MNVDPLTILLGLVFLVVLLLVESFFYLYRDLRGGDRSVNRRLQMLSAGETSEQVLLRLRRGQSSESFIARLPGLIRIDRLLTQAGVLMTTSRFVTLSGIFTAIFLVAFALVPAVPFFASVVIAPLLGFGLPMLFVLYRRRGRMKRFNEQLPDSLDIIIRSLRAGHPVTVALKMVSREMQDPAGSEFGIMVDEMTYGLDMREALANMAERMPVGDLYYLIVAINVQYGTGGNLAEVLEGLSKVIRARYHMMRKIRAISAEGRLSAIILSILPFFVFGMINLTSPRYFGMVKDDPLLPVFLVIGLILLGMGIFSMWRIVQIKV